MMKGKTYILSIFMAVIFIILSACSGTETGSQNQEENASEKLSPLNVGIINIAAMTTPWVAAEEGFFEKNGLDVELVQFNSGGEMVPALQAGAVDIILNIAGTQMTANEQGFDLLAVFQNEVAKAEGPDSGSFQVLADSDINSIGELEGKTVAVSNLHGQYAVAVKTTLEKGGVDLESINFIELPYPTMADALKNKQVDAVATLDPFTTQLQTSGVGKVLSWFYVDSVPKQPLGVFWAKTDYINENPDIVSKFNLSMKEVIDYLVSDEELAKQKVAEFTGLDEELVKSMPLIGWDYNVDPAKWQEVIDMMSQSGEIQNTHTPEEYFSEQIKEFYIK